MKELLVIAAEMMPLEYMIDELESQIKQYKADPTELNRHKLVMSCSLIITKESITTNKKGASGMIDEMNKIQKARDLMDFKVQ